MKFFSVFSHEKVHKVDPKRVVETLGIELNGEILQPPVHEECGGVIDIGDDWEEGLVVCLNCGKEFRIYKYDQSPVKP